MRTRLTADLLQRTRKSVRREVTQEEHYYYVWSRYVNQQLEPISRHTSTISRRMRGLTLPPWEIVSYYADAGTRCPAALENGLLQYIADRYYSRTHREGLRAALLDMLGELPPEDAEDIRAAIGTAIVWHICGQYCNGIACARITAIDIGIDKDGGAICSKHFTMRKNI